MTLTAAHPRAVAGLGPSVWIYADDSAATARGLRGQLGAPAVSPREFQEAAAALRPQFVQWVDDNLAPRRALDWLSTPLTRDPNAGPFLLHACWLALVPGLLARHGELAVITESAALARALHRLADERGVRFGRRGGAWFALSAGRRAARALAGFAFRATEFALRMALVRLFLGRAQRDRLAGVQALVDTYLFDADLDADGRFRDRYFPGLLEWYGRQGVKAACWPYAYRIGAARYASLYRRMRRSATLFAPFELFAHWGDLAWAKLRCLGAAFAPLRLPQPRFCGVELAPLARGHRLQAALWALGPLLLVRAARRMAAAGIRPRWLVDWYENQPLDKADAIGFGAGGCRVIACRQYLPLEAYLSLYTSTGEVGAGVAPGENWVCGRAQLSQMRRYDDRGEYRVVPALRYAWLHAQQPAAREERDLLVLLPYSREERMAILDLVLEAAPALAARFAEIRIKPHHSDSPAACRALASRLAPQAERLVAFSEAPLAESFGRARIVITAFSGTAVEAVCQGIPVVVAGRPAGFTMNPLEALDRRLWQVAYDADELEQAVARWSPHPLSQAERIALGAEIRDAYFEPVTEASMHAFLPSQASATASTGAP